MNKILPRIYNILKKVTKITLYMSLSLIIMLLLFLVFIECYGRILDARDMASEKFNSKAFKNEDIKRVKMIDDLTKNYLYKGMKISQVKGLLGEKYLFIREYNNRSFKGKCFNYYLGMLGGFMHDSYRLIICPDSSGQYLDHFKVLRITPWNNYFDGGKDIYPEYPPHINYGD